MSMIRVLLPLMLLAAATPSALANEPPTGILLSQTDISENLAIGAEVATITVLDADEGDTHTLTLLNDGGGAFRIVDDVLETTQILDREGQNQYSVRIKAVDTAGASVEASFTITVTDANDPPLGINLTNSAIAEDQDLFAAVGSFQTVGDQDSVDSHTYTLVDDADGAFVITGDTLRVNTPLDFETTSTYAIRVRSTDQGGLWVEKDFIVVVLDRNEAPTGVALTGPPIAEDAVNDTVVGTLSAVGDPDQGDTHTFELTEQGTAFAIDGSHLVVAGPLDFEDVPVHFIRVRVRDRQGRSVEGTVSVHVADVNEAPTGVTIGSDGVAEDAAIGTTIGALIADDPDAGDAHSFEIVDDPSGVFTIEEGKLRLLGSLNFEEAPSHTLMVRVTDSGQLTIVGELVVPVIDVNEPPTAVVLNNGVAVEGQAGAPAGTLETVDPDAQDTHTYEVIGASADLFETQGASLRTRVALDFESQTTHEVQVRSTDAAGHSVESTVVVSVQDANEQPTNIELSNRAVAENREIGAVVGALTTTGDPDETESYVYALVQNDGGAFGIEGDQLVTLKVLDYEAKPSYSIRIRSTDTGGLWTEQQFSVDVVNVNEPPTGVRLTGQEIAEGRPSGTFVGNLSVVGDPDVGDGHTYVLVDNPDGAFAIANASLRTAKKLDYEGTQRYTIRVRATDEGGLAVEGTFEIVVTDVNEAPTGVALSSVVVAESAPVGTEVGRLSAVGDPDSGDTHTFGLVQTETADLFQIDGDRLLTRATFDFEAGPTRYTLKIYARDSADHHVEGTFEIIVTDVNEPPLFVALDHDIVAEDAPPGTLVGTLSHAGDPDEGDTHSFSLIGGEDLPFAIVNGNQVVTMASLDHEQTASYTLMVRVTDAAGLFAEDDVDIQVGDVNEPPTAVRLDGDEVAENAPAGTIVGKLVAIGDPDDGASHVFSVVSDEADAFGVDDGDLTLTRPLDFEAAAQLMVVVEATDNGGLSIETTLVVRVLDRNDPPVIAIPGGLIALPPVAEDDLHSDGMATTAIIAALAMSDPDDGDSLGIAFIDADSDPAVGWQVREAVGAPWLTLADASWFFGVDSKARIRYVPAPDFVGDVDGPTLRAWDGDAVSDGEATLTVLVQPVNDPPTVTVPDGPIITFQHVETVIRDPDGLTIRVADIDASRLDVTLSSPDGAIVVPARPGVTASVTPDGLVISGDIAVLNRALEAARFVPAEGFHGSTTLTVVCDDGGASGAGGPLSGEATIAISVRPGADLELSRDDVILADGDVDAVAFYAGAVTHLEYQLANSGSRPLNLGGAAPIKLEGVTNAEAWVTVPPDLPLGEAEVATFVVSVRAESVGAVSLDLVFESNDDDERFVRVEIAGEAEEAPDLVIVGDAGTLPPGISYPLGHVPLGREREFELELWNLGSGVMSIDEIEVRETVNATARASASAQEISTGEVAVMTAAVEGVGSGPFEVLIAILSDDPDEPERLLLVEGEASFGSVGTLRVERLPGIEVVTADDFGSIALDDASLLTWQVANIGTRDMRLSGLRATSATSVDVAIVDALPDVLAAGESAPLTLSLTADEADDVEIEVSVDLVGARVPGRRWQVVGRATNTAEDLLRFWRIGEGLIDTVDFLGPMAVDQPRVLGYWIENASPRAITLAPPVFASDLSGAKVRVEAQPSEVVEAHSWTYTGVRVTPVVRGGISARLSVAAQSGRKATIAIASPGQRPDLVIVRSDGGGISPAGEDILPLATAGHHVVARYTLRNRGTGAMTLIGTPTMSGRACLEATEPDPLAVHPGDTSMFEVTLDIPRGAFACHVTVESNDADTPLYTFTIRGVGAGGDSQGVCGAASGPTGAGWLMALMVGWALATRRRRRPGHAG